MSKVFRISTTGSNTYTGWNESPSFPYDSTALNTVADPDGASAENEITSIPSPFARIDLVKSAFREVCRMASNNIAELDGNTIFHKMVSDSLDVGEIFFNIDKLKDKIEIIPWDPSIMIQQLQAGNSSHQLVADALDKYMQSDGQTYNFDKVHQFYLLNYVNGPDTLNIIGATSPATLFFCGANNLNYINDVFFANNDKPFDKHYTPLFKRDSEYLMAWWTYQRTIPRFAVLFPEVVNYLELTYRALADNQLKQQLNSITINSVSDFDTIDVLSNGQSNKVEVLGSEIFKKKRVLQVSNNFTIKPNRNEPCILPLVLPIESGNKYASLEYVNGKWGKTNNAPAYCEDELEERSLPYDGSIYPYITISDVMEDTIVKVPHRLNEKYFYDGNLSNCPEMTSFLLPIKPLYFKFFDVQSLQSVMSDGKPAFEMEVVAGGAVNVILRVPIEGNGKINYIEYQRLYYTQNRADAANNEGGMTTFDFSGLVTPCVTFLKDVDAYYTVSCVSTFNNNFPFEFYKANEKIHDIPTDCRNNEKGGFNYKSVTYTLEHSNFDYIRVSDRAGVSNVIVPLFMKHQNLEDYEFAIDFGTSNTHIEFRKANSAITEPFEYGDEDSFMNTFFKPTYIELDGILTQRDLLQENDLLQRDYIPANVSDNSDYHFPTRTALSYARTTDWTNSLRVFGMVNFDLTYNKTRSLAYNATPLVNIKWSRETNAQTVVQAYIRNILLLIRNKVVSINGNLQNTRITWFYPNSMSPNRLAQLTTAWKNAYYEFFNTDNSSVIRRLSESVAPIQYYFSRYASATNIVNIDIGGGTTDVAFSTNGIVKYISSFKFAANSLFADSLSDNNHSNGVVDYFKDNILRVLQSGSSNKLRDLEKVYHENEGHPADMAQFFFSLKDNSATQELNSNYVDFNCILQNDTKFKIVFIIFYTAIIYHIAQLIKQKCLPEPRHIAFSGNGSKIINVISTDTEIVANYTKVIFELVLGRPYRSELDVLGLDKNSNPKEATCKGGLINNNRNQEEPEALVLRNSNGDIASKNDTYASLDTTRKEEIADSVKTFFEFVLKKLPTKFNFDKNFGVDNYALQIARTECLKDLNTYLDKGIELSIQESGNIDNIIEDALSFYPIKGAIQAISEKINEIG